MTVTARIFFGSSTSGGLKSYDIMYHIGPTVDNMPGMRVCTYNVAYVEPTFWCRASYLLKLLYTPQDRSWACMHRSYSMLSNVNILYIAIYIPIQ